MHRMRSPGIASRHGSFAPFPLTKLHFSFLSFPLLTLSFRYIPRIIILEYSDRALGVIFFCWPHFLPMHIHFVWRWPPHFHRSWRGNIWILVSLWLAAWPRWHCITRHPTLFPRLFGCSHRRTSLSVCLRRAVSLDLRGRVGSSRGAGWASSGVPAIIESMPFRCLGASKRCVVGRGGRMHSRRRVNRLCIRRAWRCNRLRWRVLRWPDWISRRRASKH